MKKNITINLFGTLYNIDEDAYQMLNSYLESMKRYFGNKNDDNDIADDIEHRVAELLWEKKEQGIEAINIDIINRNVITRDIICKECIFLFNLTNCICPRNYQGKIFQNRFA